MKNSPWEGAVRGAAAIWSPLIKQPQRVSNRLMHISDWLPTFYSAAGMLSHNLKFPLFDSVQVFIINMYLISILYTLRVTNIHVKALRKTNDLVPS